MNTVVFSGNPISLLRGIMETECSRLADTIHQLAQNHHKPRYLVAIGGSPGSGKTTTAKMVTHLLNKGSVKRTALVSMDGFHLSRAALDKLPDPEMAHARRGAPWTFDLPRFQDFVRRLYTWANAVPLCTSVKVKDPVEDGIIITPDTSIIILEGNYLLLNEPGWRDISSLFDYRVFINIDLQEARSRVAKRHVHAGIERTLEEGLRRVDGNDYLNALLIHEKLLVPDMFVESIPWSFTEAS
ncbi:putative kinase [Aspergillus niger]|nr:putative kinase [Aspergillus niger]